MRITRSMSSGEVETQRDGEVGVVETVREESVEEYWWKQQMAKTSANYKPDISRKLGTVDVKAKTVEELLKEQQAMEIIIEKYKVSYFHMTFHENYTPYHS